jgi:magnesium chelatase family protein
VTETVGRVGTVAMVGLDAHDVTVEAHVGAGLPGFHIIGSSGAAAREAADRVRTALGAVGVTLPARKTLVSLAPADVPKAGARFDLAMAAAVLGQLGRVPQAALDGTALIGELSLDGRVRPVPGVLPSAASLARGEVRRLVVADANAAEAALVAAGGTDGQALEVLQVAHLGELLGLLQGARPRPVAPPPPVERRPVGDLADVRGQAEARRALEIAAAGGHHLLLVGPPGCGKSMLASRLPGILPPLGDEAALELAAVRSVAGLMDAAAALDRTPPFRAPHHTASGPALLGGGSGIARPGELSLATGGVLFLDELFEWPRRLLDALREPLSDGVVRVARARATVTYPAKVQLIAAANPCPCARQEGCTCTDRDVVAYRGRLSGPLADRIDLAPAVNPLRADDLLETVPGESSEVVAARVAAARAAAADRWGGAGPSNVRAPSAALRRTAARDALGALVGAIDAGMLTGRGYDRTLRVARTIADLDGSGTIRREHVLEALGHRLALATSQEPAA